MVHRKDSGALIALGLLPRPPSWAGCTERQYGSKGTKVSVATSSPTSILRDCWSHQTHALASRLVHSVEMTTKWSSTFPVLVIAKDSISGVGDATN